MSYAGGKNRFGIDEKQGVKGKTQCAPRQNFFEFRIVPHPKQRGEKMFFYRFEEAGNLNSTPVDGNTVKDCSPFSHERGAGMEMIFGRSRIEEGIEKRALEGAGWPCGPIV